MSRELPIRRTETVTHPCIAKDLISETPDTVFILLKYQEEKAQFEEIPLDSTLKKGDRLVIYAIPKGSLEAFDAVNALFNDTYYSNETYTTEFQLWPDENDLIEHTIPPNNTQILEICCGSGRITRHLVREGNPVIGIDISSPSIEFIHTHYPDVTARVADAADLPYPDNCFDRVLFLQNSIGAVFSKREKILDELIRVCNSGGKILIGCRTLGDTESNGIQVYISKEGFIELAETFDYDRMQKIVDHIQTTPTITSCTLETRPGTTRPWGGYLVYLILTIEKAGPIPPL